MPEKEATPISVINTAMVAVSGVTFAIDKPYTYRVPEELTEICIPGVRVILPFGKGNRKTEGMILRRETREDDKGFKSIISALDNEPILCDSQIKLALWMRERCFCTFYDCLRAMLPAGLWYTLKKGWRLADAVTREQALGMADENTVAGRIVLALISSGGRCLEEDLASAAGTAGLENTLKKLCRDGIITQTTHEIRKVKDKTAAIARLNASEEDARIFIKRKKKSAAMQTAVVELLCDLKSAPVKDICYFTGASVQSVRALERSGMVRLEYVESFRRPEYGAAAENTPEALNTEQQKAYESLEERLKSGKAQVTLLYGITGSGKTAVYIKLIEKALGLGKNAIVLVPEIALTPQLLSVFTACFGNSIALLHSSLGAAERYDEWKRIKSGMARVVVGTRSAVFAPVRDLGLMIIDEEQEHTYKSENSPRYHTRDVAKYICYQSGALLVLGSATPSVESTYNALNGKYSLVTIEGRYNNAPLPAVIIADMKKELKKGNGGTISTALREELLKNIERGEQSIIFINRRGANSVIACPECGYTYSCPNCSVSLTYHSANRRMLCHYCGHSEPVSEYCPECSAKLRFIGAGTQLVVQELEELFPGVEIIRMDADSLSAVNTHQAMFDRFEKNRIPIMVGTQMVAKGLNFNNVTLVGVISVDQSLYASDYRAPERTFSLITQVIGRSGRADKPGRAVLQTYTPENEIIQLAARQDYKGFYEREIAVRELLGCPPAADMFVITVSGEQEDRVLTAILRLKATIERGISRDNPYRLLGPVPAAVARVNGRYRYQLTLTGSNNREGRELTARTLKLFALQPENRGLSASADINPIE